MKINDLFKHDLLNSKQVIFKENGGYLKTNKYSDNFAIIILALIFGTTAILLTKKHKNYERTRKEN